jgi:hypothetical protein
VFSFCPPWLELVEVQETALTLNKRVEDTPPRRLLPYAQLTGFLFFTNVKPIPHSMPEPSKVNEQQVTSFLISSDFFLNWR